MATVTLVVAGTARSTVANAAYYRTVLDEEDTYDRLYDQVLVDPEASGVTRNLLGRLPVPQAIVTSNLKTVLPPSTTRAMANQVIGQAVTYLRGDTDQLKLTVDLRPVLTNLGDLGHIYFADTVAGLQQKPAPDYRAFQRELDDAVTRIADGQRPDGLPTLDLSDRQAEAATDALLKAVPAGQRGALRPRVEAALGSGDLATALAEVGPVAFAKDKKTAASQLRDTADGSTWNLTADLDRGGADGRDGLAPVREARAFTKLGLGWVQTIAAVLGGAALATLWFAGPPAPGRRLKRVGLALATGGALALALVLAARWFSGGTAMAAPRGWPDSADRLLGDLQQTAMTRLFDTALSTAAFPLVAGALLAAGGWTWQRQAARMKQTNEANEAKAPKTEPTLPPRYRWAAIGVTAAALAGAVLVPNAFGGESEHRCNGRADLCDVPYDQVAQVASHNSMSTSEDKFIGPLQDPSITGQLNDGVRALLIDTHRWETPKEVTARLAESDFTPGMRQQIRSVINTLDPPRKGTWLCHAVCRGGAIPLVPELGKVREWMDNNPAEVVTLVIQDGISGEETARALHAAGLDELAYTPDADPDAPWPTLGEMTEDGKRLVVFAERADGPARYYRNYYRYGMETPFAFSKPQDMTCAPNRGGTGKRLFLMNHFVTNGGGSRLDAGEINAKERVLQRARQCEKQRGRPVNLVAVDYATIGDVSGAVNELNDERVRKLDR
nr:hypothetical protein [Streptomyces coryli]